MNKLISILVLDAQFEAAVETPAGFECEVFPNTGDGVEAFSSFAARFVRTYGAAFRFCLCAPQGDLGVIGEELMANGYGPSILNPHALSRFALTRSLSENSATTLAYACMKEFPMLRTD